MGIIANKTDSRAYSPRNDHSLEVRVGVSRTTSMAPSLEEISEIPHSEIFAAIDAPKIKLTPRSVQFDAEQAPILAMHWLNPPFKDGLFTVNALYQKIKKMAQDYQREHTDAFFMQYPELMILTRNEQDGRWQMTSDECRQEYRKFARRLAHYIWHYQNAMCAYIASCANLCILGHINGTGKFNDFGEAFKIGYINNALNRYAAFFKPTGLEDYIVKYSKFATGSTTYGADIVSFPLWVTDIKGNRGAGTINFKDLFAGVRADGMDVRGIQNTSKDYDDYDYLVRNMAEARNQFIWDSIFTTEYDQNEKIFHENYVADRLVKDIKDEQYWASRCAPTSPKIENGETIAFDDALGLSDISSAAVYGNSDGYGLYNGLTRVKVGNGRYVENDNIINKVWDSFTYWREYLETYFCAFSKPSSELVRICSEQGWIEKTTHNSSWLFTNINTKECFDMASLREHMIYKRDNKVTTATQIKWVPILDQTGVKDDLTTYSTAYDDSLDDGSGYFDKNFNRYPVDLDDPVEIVQASKRWPGISPTIFHQLDGDTNGDTEPTVINGIPCGCQQVNSNVVEPNFPAKGVLGKYATMLDYVSSSHMDAEHTSVSIIALDPEVAKTFIKSGNGLVPKETMDYPRATVAPLIDCTDPYQCGFNYVHFAFTQAETEFDRWFLDGSKYPKKTEDTGDLGSYTNPDSVNFPTNPSYTGTGNVNQQMSILNNGWRASNRYSLIFVGDGIWYHPEVIAMMLGAGQYDEEYLVGANAPAAADNELAATLQAVVQGVQVPTDHYHINCHRQRDLAASALTAGQIIASELARSYATTDLAGTSKNQLSVAGFLSLLNQLPISGDAQGLNVDDCLFNPLYGPVLPVKYDTPDIGTCALMGMSAAEQPATTALNPEFQISQVRLGGTAQVGYHVGANALRQSLDSFRSVAQFLLWPIDDLKFRKVFRLGRRLYAPEREVEMAGFSGAAKVALALLSRSNVMYTGIEDTMYLDSVEEPKVETPDIQAGSTIGYGAQVKAPINGASRIPTKQGFTPRKSVKRVRTAEDKPSSVSNNFTSDKGDQEMRDFSGDKSYGLKSEGSNRGNDKGKNRDSKRCDRKSKSKEDSKVAGLEDKILETANQNASDAN